jgi:hypothetical protein
MVYGEDREQWHLLEPQTMYLLLAAILCGLRQFVVQALTVKKENDLFI